MVASASANESLMDALTQGTPYVDARYRYEFADQANRAQDAHASTLRVRAGYATGDFHGFSATGEAEHIQQIGSDNYNDTLNGRTNHPVVADIESTEINQLFLQFDGVPDTRLRVGRERINLNNQRFIGSVGWRQNDQTYDAATLQSKAIEDTVIDYGHIKRVNRIFGEDSPNGNWDSNSHYLQITNNSLSVGKVSAYAHLIDLERDAPAFSSKTFGLQLVGKTALSEEVDFHYHAEYARQSDYGDNTANYSADYVHLAPALSYSGLKATLGYELLGSDNGTSFSTPLATLHKFNGFADVFLNAAALPNGLEDVYIDLTYKLSNPSKEMAYLKGLLLKAAYHEFSSDTGNIDYGTEFDAYAKLPFETNYYAELKYGDYDADNFSVDTQRITFGLGATF